MSFWQVQKWSRLINQALSESKLLPGQASKLAGKLAWGGSHMFKRIGRALLRPLYDQRSRRDGKVDSNLRRALQWWVTVLQANLVEARPWVFPQTLPLHLFCDARGSPPHLAAVLFIGDKCKYVHMEPSEEIMSSFRRRKDNQIMALELLAISVGLCSFENDLRDRRIVVHCDNTGSEVEAYFLRAFVCVCLSCLQAALRKGTARSFDHAQLVHEQWLHAAKSRMHLHVVRVPTEFNIADCPSREDFAILEAMGAIKCEARLANSYMRPETWKVLEERWQLW